MAHERRLAHMRFAPEESPYPFVAMVPQNVTEKLLAESLRRKGGLIEYETTFQSAEQFDQCAGEAPFCLGEKPSRPRRGRGSL